MQYSLSTPNDFVDYLYHNKIHRADIISTDLNMVTVLIGHLSKGKISQSDLDNNVPVGVNVKLEVADNKWLRHRKKNSYRLMYPAIDMNREVSYVKRV